MLLVIWAIGGLGPMAGSAAAGSARVILAGPLNPESRGYGHVKPNTLFVGGEGSLIQHIHWQSWGGARAMGTGVAWYVAPNQSIAGGRREPARLVAYRLGQCDGERAYDAIDWYFPQHGQAFNPNDPTFGGLCAYAEERHREERGARLTLPQWFYSWF